MLRLTRWLLTLVLCNAGAHGQYPGAQPPPDELKSGFDAVRVEDTKRILTYLATQCEGRGTGQRGYEKAAKFVANEFKRLGLKPFGASGSYFQRARVSTGRDMRIEFRGPGGAVEFGGKDYRYFRHNGFKFDGPISLFGKPAFFEYSGNPAELPDARQLMGRIVFMHSRGNLDNDGSDGQAIVKYFQSLSKARPAGFFGVEDDFEAFKRILDSNGLFHGPHWTLEDGPAPDHQPGNGNLSSQALTAILRAANVRKSNAALMLGEDPIAVEIRGKVDSEWTENVVGLLEGSDPALKAEYVVVGGHLDHWGIQNGSVFPGVDDDASGATDVIETAKAIVANPKKPRRSIIFVTFFGEEQGLLGSSYFVSHSPVPIGHIMAELEMDMVGRDSDGDQQDDDHKRVDKASENVDTLRVVGSRRISPTIDLDVQKMNSFVNFRLLYDSESVFGRSDDAVFARHHIPTAWLFSGFHPDYHQTTDTVDKIDWPKVTNTAKLVYLTVLRLADAEAPTR